MTGITVDVSGVEASEPFDEQNVHHVAAATGGAEESSAVAISTALRDQNMLMNSAAYDRRFLAMVSPRNQRRTNSRDFMETADFLRTCGLCKRRLAAGRDIYMYRGDTAFCSLECREEQMKQDERKEKYGVVSSTRSENHEYHRHHGASSPT